LSLLFMSHVSSFGSPFISAIPSIPYLLDPIIQSDDISRTAKFMSSPLVQSLASSRPVQVSTIFLVLTPFLGVCFCPILPTPTAFFFGSPRHICNALQIKPSHATPSMISQMLSLRYVHMPQCRHIITHTLFIDRTSSIRTSAGVQQCIIIIAARRAYSRTACCLPVVSFRREAGVDPSRTFAHLFFPSFH